MDYQPLKRSAADFQQPPSALEIASVVARMLGDDTCVRVVSAREIGGGAFNNAFLLTLADGRRHVLRVSPPHGHRHLFFVEHHLLRREYSLTPWMANLSPWLPRVTGVDFTQQTFPRDAVLSEFIEGDNWDALMPALTADENAALWRELAGLLHRVHATPAPHFGWTHPAKPHTNWGDFILEGARGLLGDFSRLGVDDTEARAWLAVAETGAAILGEITEPRVLHGDPWPKNVLVRRVDGRMRIVALLDHERGLFGDPWQEWVFHGCDFPPVFWEAFGARPTDPASRFRAAVYRGVIDLQCLLESVRYECDTSAARPRLLAGIEEMRRLRAELGP